MQHPPLPAPRLVVAGLSGDSGKTLVSLGLLFLAHQHGISTRAFKKGPDYIDAAWLSWASGSQARNLDTFLMGPEKAAKLFGTYVLPGGLNLIEGNRGIFDGLDAHGTHSTAQLAKLLDAPVLLVVNATKVTHTVAALVLGCQKLDRYLRIGGIILNHVSGRRHEAVLRESIESACRVPVLGVLPNVDAGALLPGRHLGLVTPQENRGVDELRTNILSAIQGRLDFGRIFELAKSAPPVPGWDEDPERTYVGRGLKIAFLQDSAFTFYYPENLEALERSSAELVPLSALSASALPEDLDTLYIGGGFPETHAERLSANTSLLASIRDRAQKGLPIYAECGGLMLLSQAIHWQGKSFPMAGALPFEVEVCARPQGHGYVELLVDRPNPYYSLGTRILGHEFHYSKTVTTGSLPATACAVRRGTGCSGGRDGVVVENIWASYAHVHAVATPEWAKALVIQARLFHGQRCNSHLVEHPVCAGSNAGFSVSSSSSHGPGT